MEREYPDVMAQAADDLRSHLSGHFSPEDWQKILDKAHALWLERTKTEPGEREAWASVVRDFHKQDHWGFTPNYKPPRPKPNLGVIFIVMAFLTFTFAIMAVVWIGQLYVTNGGEGAWGPLLAVVMTSVVAGFGYMLWRQRKYK